MRHRPWEGFEALEQRQLLFAISWDGGGGDFSWHNPLNWYGDVLPGPDDDVFINVAGTPTITHDQEVLTSVRSITSSERIELGGGTISVESLWKQIAPLSITGGRLEGAGNLLLNADADWTGGELAGSGKVQILPDREFRIAGDVVLSRTIINNGSLLWDSGTIDAHGAYIHNLPGRTFLIRSDGSLVAASGESWIQNRGVLALDGAPGVTTTIGINLSSTEPPRLITPIFPFPGFPFPAPAPPVPSGIVDVRSGTLEFTGEVAQKAGDILIDGHWWVTSSDAALLLPGPDITRIQGRSSVVLTGQGSAFPQIATAATIPSLTLNDRAYPLAVYSSIGTLTINTPGLTLAPHGLTAGTLDIQQGRFIVGDLGVSRATIAAGSELAVTGSMLMTASPFNILGSATGFGGIPGTAISGEGTFRITGTLRMEGGSVAAGTMIIGPTGRLEVVGDDFLHSNRRIHSRLVNFGVIDWSGTDTWTISSEVVNRGTFIMRGYGFVNTSAGLTPAIAPAWFHNFGTLTLADGAEVTFRGAGGGVRFVNRGRVHVENGTLNLFGGTTSIRSGPIVSIADWQVDAGSELVIGGLSASFTNASVLAPGRIRIGTDVAWNSGSIQGTGDMIIGPTGHLSLVGFTGEIARSLTINNGTIDVEGNITMRGALRNYGTVALGGTLSVDHYVPGASSVLRIRSIDEQHNGLLKVVTGGFFAGTLAIDFSWQPPVNTVITVYFALIYNQPGGMFAEFSDVVATGLPPGREVSFDTVPGQQTTVQGNIMVT